MLFNNKLVSQLEEQDLLEIVTSQETETKTLEFKRKISINTDAEKKEFLYDVTSFANASGGIIFYGIEEKEGFASSIRGMKDINPDKEKLKIESVLKSAVAPRIPGITIHSIELSDKSIVIIISVPKSWASPHMVTYKGISKFFTRHSNGKYPMDVQEIRQAFLLTENISTKIKEFRLNRIGNVISGELPVTMDEKAKVILHCIPISAFELAQQVDIKSIRLNLYQISQQISSTRYNFDGLLAYTKYGNDEAIEYIQVFRTGIIEIVDNYLLNAREDGKRQIPGKWLEDSTIKRFKHSLDTQKSLGISPPFLLSMTLIGIKNYTVVSSSRAMHFPRFSDDNRIEKDTLLIPEVLLENYPTDDLDVVLKPMLDTIWNASGREESPRYKNGKWLGK